MGIFKEIIKGDLKGDFRISCNFSSLFNQEMIFRRIFFLHMGIHKRNF